MVVSECCTHIEGWKKGLRTGFQVFGTPATVCFMDYVRYYRFCGIVTHFMGVYRAFAASDSSIKITTHHE